jgi:antagonist of KipI
MGIRVRKAGILDTIQDLGRHGLAKFGINSNGVMDRTAARLINGLLGNHENEAVIETHFPSGEFEFDDDTTIAIGGAEFCCEIDGCPVENWRPIPVEEGSALRFTRKHFGNRAYIAVKGGFDVEPWLGSKSTNLVAKAGGFEGRKLAAGDNIRVKPSSEADVIRNVKVSNSLIPFYSKFPTVRVLAGPEFELLDEDSRTRLFSENYQLSMESNRMGFRLKGEKLSLAEAREYISSGVAFGTIQLLPDGQLIVLMADHQTTGGYPRIANAIDIDLPLLAQLGPSDKVAFHPITLDEAEKLSERFENEISLFRTGIRFSGQTR